MGGQVSSQSQSIHNEFANNIRENSSSVTKCNEDQDNSITAGGNVMFNNCKLESDAKCVTIGDGSMAAANQAIMKALLATAAKQKQKGIALGQVNVSDQNISAVQKEINDMEATCNSMSSSELTQTNAITAHGEMTCNDTVIHNTIEGNAKASCLLHMTNKALQSTTSQQSASQTIDGINPMEFFAVIGAVILGGVMFFGMGLKFIGIFGIIGAAVGVIISLTKHTPFFSSIFVGLAVGAILGFVFAHLLSHKHSPVGKWLQQRMPDSVVQSARSNVQTISNRTRRLSNHLSSQYHTTQNAAGASRPNARR